MLKKALGNEILRPQLKGALRPASQNYTAEVPLSTQAVVSDFLDQHLGCAIRELLVPPLDGKIVSIKTLLHQAR